MHNPKDVGILIFDLDGTILQSDKAVLLVTKKALSDSGIKAFVSEEDIRNNLGEPAEQFFKNILGENYSAQWKEMFMEKYDSMIPQFASAFPDVAETLDVLKKRGYKLALYSNSESGYLDNALLKLNIRQYFDYTKCNSDNNLSKSGIIKKILDKFPGLNAAVIGDKIHDIVAAQENNALSVGALYGYGKDEPKKADITINKFSDLLDIFNKNA